MEVRVVLKDNETGVVHEIVESFDDALDKREPRDHVVLWTQGNLSCDDNRALRLWPEKLEAWRKDGREVLPCGEVQFELLSIHVNGDSMDLT